MLKLLKKLTKKEWALIGIIFVLIFCQVWLELKMPDYMSEITVLVQTEGSQMKDILTNGAYMLLCAFGSLISAILVGYIAANISATFSMKTRKRTSVGYFSSEPSCFSSVVPLVISWFSR